MTQKPDTDEHKGEVKTMTMLESVVNDVRSIFSLTERSQGNVSAAVGVLERLVMDMELNSCKDDEDLQQEWLEIVILVWQTLTAIDEFYLARIRNTAHSACYKGVDLLEEAEKNDTEA